MSQYMYIVGEKGTKINKKNAFVLRMGTCLQVYTEKKDYEKGKECVQSEPYFSFNFWGHSFYDQRKVFSLFFDWIYPVGNCLAISC
jgi:hypothetical protein